jgi:hypothetical protein
MDDGCYCRLRFLKRWRKHVTFLDGYPRVKMGLEDRAEEGLDA